MEAPTAVSPPPLRLGLHLGLLALTLVTTSFAGVILAGPGLGREELARAGVGFAVALLGILLAHEMGHYVFARIHGVDTTLPFVIPVPPVLPGLGFISFGTLGAVIKMRSPIATRDALVDIGAAGPLVGALVALPVLALGLHWSHYAPSPTAGVSFWLGHNSLFGMAREYWAARHGVAAPVAQTLALGDDLFMRLCERAVLGPRPAGQDAVVHPVAMAAWFGLLVTSLNLFPIGQLDGGHLTFALFGAARHQRLGRAVGVALLVMAIFSSLSWAAWWLVATRLVGYDHPPIREDRGGLDPLRIGICIASLALFILTFIPVPMDQL